MPSKSDIFEYIRKIRLYHYPGTRSARVKWLLHELLGDDFESRTVSLYDGELYGAHYLGITPSHCVPALELLTDHGSVTTIESGAMIVLLADIFPDQQLAPPAHPFSHERADYLQMIHYCGAAMDMMLWQIRIHEHLLPERERDHRTIRRYRKKFVAEVEPQLKRRLDGGGFACGTKFSAADCMTGHGVMWAKAYQLCSDPIFDDYMARLSLRPAFRSAFSDADKFQLQPPPGSPSVELFTG